MLMLEHPLSNEQPGPKSIDVDYIIDMMRQDWGFYYTFTTNLKRVPEHFSEFPSIREDQRGVIQRPHRRAARGHRGGAKDDRLEDALEDRHAEPLVPGSLGEVGAILTSAKREELDHADRSRAGASHP